MLQALVLKLRHALHFTDIGKRIEHPSKLRMCGDIGLHIQGAFFGIDAAGNIERRQFQRAAAELCGLLTHRNGVHVCNRIKTDKFLLKLHPVADGADIVPDGEIAARLNGRV